MPRHTVLMEFRWCFQILTCITNDLAKITNQSRNFCFCRISRHKNRIKHSTIRITKLFRRLANRRSNFRYKFCCALGGVVPFLPHVFLNLLYLFFHLCFLPFCSPSLVFLLLPLPLPSFFLFLLHKISVAPLGPWVPCTMSRGGLPSNSLHLWVSPPRFAALKILKGQTGRTRK